MGAIQYRRGSHRTAVVMLVVAGMAVSGSRSPLVDEPVVWHEDDRRDIPMPESREPNLSRDALESSLFRPMGRFFDPGRFVRRVGTLIGGEGAQPAANLNSLDEVPNSSWFTNRIGLFPTSVEEAASGPMTGSGPDRSETWEIVSAKTQGVTPGFTIRDGLGDRYLIKFDAPGYPRMATAAGVISGRILHTAGYNVPEDGLVEFSREDLVVGEDVELTLQNGSVRRMTEADLDQILASVEGSRDGRWRALASKYLDGIPRGPFDWRGRRHDDPNDAVNHEDRRELRGLRMFAAWLCHFDTKQENTLDMYVEENGNHYLKHYLIDLASTLGAGAKGPIKPFCFEYSVDLAAIVGRAISLGLHQDPWRQLERPENIPEIGYFESEIFDPMTFKPSKPTTAFANFTSRDGYWAAKIISAFSTEHLTAIVAQGEFGNQEASDWIVRILAERRDKIARYWFDRVPSLDFFHHNSGTIGFDDLGTTRGLYDAASTRYRVRMAASNEMRHTSDWTTWTELSDRSFVIDELSEASIATGVDSTEYPFYSFELQVTRGSRWSSSVFVHVSRASGRVVALDR